MVTKLKSLYFKTDGLLMLAISVSVIIPLAYVIYLSMGANALHSSILQLLESNPLEAVNVISNSTLLLIAYILLKTYQYPSDTHYVCQMLLTVSALLLQNILLFTILLMYWYRQYFSNKLDYKDVIKNTRLNVTLSSTVAVMCISVIVVIIRFALQNA